jgi:hypothetical protein
MVALNPWRNTRVPWNRGCVDTCNVVESVFHGMHMFNKEEEHARLVRVNLLLRHFEWTLILLSLLCVRLTSNQLSPTPAQVTNHGDVSIKLAVKKLNHDMRLFNKVKADVNHVFIEHSH